MIFKIDVRIYYSHTDAGGVVYHSRYLDFCEQARTEYIRSLGIEQINLKETENILFVVRKSNIEFKSPARLDDLITVTIENIEIKGCIMKMNQKIYNCNKLLINNDVELVIVDKNFNLIRKFPENLLKKFKL